MRNELYKMFRWVINKYFEKNPDGVISCGELKWILQDVWNNMVKDGEIHLIDEDNEKKQD